MSLVNSNTTKALMALRAPRVEMRAIKLAGGEETRRFEAKLYLNDVLITVVFNEGCGGPNTMREIDRPGCKTLRDFVAEIPPERHETLGMLEITMDLFLAELLEIELMRRKFKTHTFFEHKGQTYSIKQPFSLKVKDYILKEKPGAIIVNEALDKNLQAKQAERAIEQIAKEDEVAWNDQERLLAEEKKSKRTP